SITRLVHGQPLNILAVLVGNPDIGEISEHDAPVRVAGITYEPGFAGKDDRSKGENEQTDGQRVEYLHDTFSCSAVKIWSRRVIGGYRASARALRFLFTIGVITRQILKVHESIRSV